MSSSDSPPIPGRRIISSEFAQRETTYGGVRRRTSLVVLVLVNLLPLVGVLMLGWDVAALMVLYWSENLVLGFYTLLKMLVVSPLRALGMGTFFVIHYGGFCAVHGLFIVTLLLGEGLDPMPGDPWPAFLVFPQMLVNVVRQVLVYAPPDWLLAVAALYISHGVSFVVNFLIGRERDELNLSQLMAAPYGRIMILHVAILLGGFAVIALGQPVAMLAVLVLLKLALDVVLHLREHRALAIRRSTPENVSR
tara:strand:- start:40578 stop:41327 length:750 start_codon:yes stop_codon:yes gene_type:complete